MQGRQKGLNSDGLDMKGPSSTFRQGSSLFLGPYWTHLDRSLRVPGRAGVLVRSRPSLSLVTSTCAAPPEPRSGYAVILQRPVGEGEVMRALPLVSSTMIQAAALLPELTGPISRLRAEPSDAMSKRIIITGPGRTRPAWMQK